MGSNIAGKRFTRLTAVKPCGKNKSGILWECVCDCGKIVAVLVVNLNRGHSKSCGCLRASIGRLSNTPTYNVWTGMINRCTNPNNKCFSYYGGRGIKVCERWKEYVNFLNDMGEKEAGMSIERIDNNGNYEPSNCRWIPMSQQGKNRRNNRLITHLGETLIASDWDRRLGIGLGRTAERVRNNIDPFKNFSVK